MAAGSDRHVDVQQTWDLLDLKLAGGDHVQTKLVAIDRKGQVSESAPLQLTIRPSGLDTERHATLSAKERAAESLQQFAVGAETQVRHAREIIQSLLGDQANEAQRRLYSASLLESAQRLAADANLTQRVLADALQKMPFDSDAYDVLSAAAALIAVQHRTAREAAGCLYEAQSAADASVRRRRLEEAREAFDRANNAAQQADRWLMSVMNPDAVAVALEDFYDVIRLQQRSKPAEDLSRDEAKLARRMLARRETAIDAYLAETDASLRPTAERLSLRPLLDAFSASAAIRRTLEPLASRESSGARLLAFAEQLTQTLIRARAGLRPLYANGANELGKARPQFYAATVGSVSRQLTGAMTALLQSSQQQGSQPTPEAENARRRLAAVEWPASVESLRARAALEEIRPHADRQFVSDLDTIAAAAQALFARTLGATTAEATTDTSSDPRSSCRNSWSRPRFWRQATTCSNC